MLSKIIFLFFILTVDLSNGKVSDEDALNYLNKYGYVLEPSPKLKNGPASLADSKSTLKDTITRFQTIHGLNVTGVLDEPTEKKMKAPRCSLPDFRPEGKLAFYKAASKWRKKDLTYKVLNENEELKGQTRRIIGEAFKIWEDTSGLTFSEVNPSAKSDLSIKFGSKNHGDNYPFDGPGGVLAHAFFPEHGEIHFDEDEHFTDKKKDGSDLKIIAVHEFGHALGLEHSLVQGAVMNPYYQGYEENFKLGKDDIDGIQFLYGKPNSNPLPTTTSTTTKTTVKTTTLTTTTKSTTKSQTTATHRPITITTKSSTTTTTPKKTTFQTTTTTSIDKIMDFLPCHISKQAVFIGSDLATVYAILEDDYGLFKFDAKSRIWKKDNIEAVYPRLPLTARGGAIDDKGIIWFFNDYEVYAYSKNQLLSGYPKTVNDFLYPRHPYAAAFKNQKIYIYKNWLSYEFDVTKLKVTNIHRTGTIFKGIPLHIDAAFRYNGFYYFFNDEIYYKYDEKTAAVIKGYPKLTSQDWFLCMGHQTTNKIKTTRPTTKKLYTTTTRKFTTTTTKKSDYKSLACSSPKKAVFLNSDRTGIYVVLKSGASLKYEFKTKKWISDIPSNSYRSLPRDTVGGAVDNKGRIWFFKEQYAYIYERSNQQKDSPIRTQTIFNPDAVFHLDNELYLIKGSNVFKSETGNKLKVKKVYRLDQIFPDIKTKIESILEHEGFFYFFSDKLVYKYETRSKKIVKGYPKSVTQGWPPCN